MDGDVGKDPEPAKAAGKASAIVDRALWSYLTPDAQLDEFTGAWLAESGLKLSEFAAQVMYDYDKPGRDIAEKAGNTIVQLPPEEVARFKEASQPVIARWVADMESKGIDGNALIEQAKALIAKHGG